MFSGLTPKKIFGENEKSNWMYTAIDSKFTNNSISATFKGPVA